MFDLLKLLSFRFVSPRVDNLHLVVVVVVTIVVVVVAVEGGDGVGNEGRLASVVVDVIVVQKVEPELLERAQMRRSGINRIR